MRSCGGSEKLPSAILPSCPPSINEVIVFRSLAIHLCNRLNKHFACRSSNHFEFHNASSEMTWGRSRSYLLMASKLPTRSLKVRIDAILWWIKKNALCDFAVVSTFNKRNHPVAIFGTSPFQPIEQSFRMSLFSPLRIPQCQRWDFVRAKSLLSFDGKLAPDSLIQSTNRCEFVVGYKNCPSAGRKFPPKSHEHKLSQHGIIYWTGWLFWPIKHKRDNF